MNSLRAYYFFIFLVYAVVVPHYQLFLSSLGYVPREVGLLIGFFEIAGVAGPMFFGAIADRTGRFRELKVGATIGAGVFLSVLLGRLPLAAALLVSGCAGFLFKSSVPLTDAAAGTILANPREEFGRVRVFGSAGFVAGSVLVPLTGLVDPGQPASMVVAFLTSIALFASVVLLIPVPRKALVAGASLAPAGDARGTRGLGGSLRPGREAIPATFWLMVGSMAIGNVAFGAFNSFFSLYLREDLGIQSVTLYWAVGAVSEIPIIFFSGILIRRFGTGRMMVAGGLAMTLRLLLYALRPAIPAMVMIQTLHALSFGLMLSAGVAHTNHVVPASRRGAAMTAFNALGMGLPVFMGAVIGGYLVELFGYTGMFVVIALFPAVGAGTMLLLLRRDAALARTW